MANRAFKFLCYPDKQQFTQIMKTVGCCRFVYNQVLAWKNAAYAADKTSIPLTVLSNALTQTKKFYPWLAKVDSIALQQSLRHLDTAFNNFFDPKLKAKYPKFKSKNKSRWAYTSVVVNGNIHINRKENTVTLPKIGDVRIVLSRDIPEGWTLTSVTVSVERDRTVYISCLFDYDDIPVFFSVDREHSIGFDYKSDGLYEDSDGHVCGSPKYIRKSQEKLAKEQRKLRHKQPGSNNYEKQKVKVAKVHHHIANQRKDFLHKESTKIANSYDIVCIEDLNMKDLSNKGFGNGKATMDNGWGMFVNMLAYKLQERGKILVKVSKWSPSSQLCHVCGYQNPEVKDTRIRYWKCPSCGAEHDRDHNAAINIKTEGLRILYGTAT